MTQETCSPMAMQFVLTPCRTMHSVSLMRIVIMPKRSVSVCPICFKGRLIRRKKTLTYSFRGHSITYKQPGAWCTQCDEGILTGMDALATWGELSRWRDEVLKVTEGASPVDERLATEGKRGPHRRKRSSECGTKERQPSRRDLQRRLTRLAQQGLRLASRDDVVLLADAIWYGGFTPQLKGLSEKAVREAGYVVERLARFNVLPKARKEELRAAVRPYRPSFKTGNLPGQDVLASIWGASADLSRFFEDLLPLQTRQYARERHERSSVTQQVGAGKARGTRKKRQGAVTKK